MKKQVGLALLLLSAGCSTTAIQVGGRSFSGGPTRFSGSLVNCAEATRAARVAVQRLGYTVVDVQAAEIGKRGEIIAERELGFSSGDPTSRGNESIYVTIDCSDRGADFQAGTTQEGLAGLAFGRSFKRTLEAEMGRKAERPRLEQEKSRGLLLEMTPLRSAESRERLAIDLPAAGIAPVWVVINNQSDRTYAFTADSFRMYTVEDQREEPMAVASVRTRIDAATGSEAARRLDDERLVPAELAPGASASGYLYFRAASFRRGRAALTDIASGEAEGFAVEF